MEQKTIWTNKYFIAAMAIFACILWGSAFPVLKITYAELQIDTSDVSARMLIAGVRFFVAGALLFIIQGLVFRQPVKVRKDYFLPLLLLGLAQTGLQYFFFYNGVAHTSGIKSAILNSVGNFFVVVLAHFVYQDDRLNSGKILGLLTGFAGITLVNWQSGGGGFDWSFRLTGEGFLILAGLTSALGTFQAKKLTSKINPVTVNAYQLLLGSLVLLVLGIPALFSGTFQPTPVFWGLLFYSAVLSATAFSIWYSLLKYNKAGEVTIYRFMIPVAGSILSAILLPDEQLTSSVFFALLLVVVGISMVNIWQHKEAKYDTN